MKVGERLASLDALRGFDMFFICGGAALIAGVCAALGCGDGWLAGQMKHVPWAGLAHHDTIFPLFLFLAGASWPFSLAAQRSHGLSDGRIRLKILRRAAILFGLGFSFVFLSSLPHFRLMTVLGFIGICWGLSALVFMHVRRPWQRFAVFTILALGYFAFLHFLLMPGAPVGADSYSKEWNIVRHFDLLAYPEHLMIPVSVAAAKGVVPYEPESLFSVPGGMLIALMGMFAGCILRTEWSGCRKTLALLAAALGALIVDLTLVFVVGVPIVKALWTVSFAFAAATYSFALLAVFFLVIDVWKIRAWTVVFDPIGKNSIFAYMVMMTGVLGALRHYLAGGLIRISGDWGEAVGGLVSFAILWGITRFAQKKGIFFKV